MQLDLYPTLPNVEKLQPLSQFLTQRKVFITIDDATEYKRCRVQSNRKGIVLRDLAKGAAINTKKQQVCRPGDFIVAEIDAKVGGYGFIPPALDGAIVSSHYYLFEVDESKLLPRYLHYLTQSNIIQGQISSQGSTNYAAIRPKEFLAIEIPYVEPAQQREIVARLDAVTQEAEAVNKESTHQATLLTRLRQAMLREAVQGRLVPQEATDEPAPTLLARIRAEKQRLVKEKKLRADKPLPPLSEAEVPYEVPEGWAWCRLGEAGVVKGGIQKSSNRKPIKNHYPYLRVANVQRGYLLLNEIERFELTNEELSSWKLEKGDLLIVEGNGSQNEIGRCAIWDGSIPNCVHQNHLIRCRLLDKIDPQYLVAFLNSPFGKKQMVELAITSIGLYSLSVGKITQLTIPLPPLAEQRRIVAKVTELLAHCTELETELQRARQAAEALHAAALREAFQGAPVAVSA